MATELPIPIPCISAHSFREGKSIPFWINQFLRGKWTSFGLWTLVSTGVRGLMRRIKENRCILDRWELRTDSTEAARYQTVKMTKIFWGGVKNSRWCTHHAQYVSWRARSAGFDFQPVEFVSTPKCSKVRKTGQSQATRWSNGHRISTIVSPAKHHFLFFSHFRSLRRWPCRRPRISAFQRIYPKRPYEQRLPTNSLSSVPRTHIHGENSPSMSWHQPAGNYHHTTPQKKEIIFSNSHI